ncbi:unnamed protein product [Symbiodinium necroappetens]|uniref:Reverse transcriptase domain-containing protein n=1 Tax=Symbiodinium necroappetens TaxID=1628268 RepID=A0A812WYS3_9DINO|nr:unnamed protein product [Symbiodinium necroappetens]
MNINLYLPGSQDKALRLPDFSVKDAAEGCVLSQTPPEPEGIIVVGQDFTEDKASKDFGILSRWCQQAMYPEEKQARGGTLEFRRLAPVQEPPNKSYSTQAGLWLRIESWLNAVAKAGVKVSHKALAGVVNQLQFGEMPIEEADRWRAELLAHFQCTSLLESDQEEMLRSFIKQAQSDHLAADKQRYQAWLEGAMVKGMRPLYNAIRSHEQVLVRPFRNKEATLRPYLRHQQWQEIWKSQDSPVEPVLPELLSRAVEAAMLPAITVTQLQTRLQCLSEKAPGVDGWNNRMLKQLPPTALEPLTQFLNHMEATGKAPGQWRVVKFAMLAKNKDIERPIGLCNVVYKAWLQVRYSLIQNWIKQYELKAHWDAAMPGNTCLSVSISRVFKSEIAVATGRHRASVYLDLTTFYGALTHARLIESAKELAFPASILNIAIQVYRGARIIDAEGSMSPVSFTS